MIGTPPKHLPPLGPPKRPPRDTALAAWHGYDIVAAEKTHSSAARQAGEVLQQVLNKLQLDRRLAEAELVRVWNNLLDPNIAAHAQPTGLRKGTLYVSVDSSVWLHELVRYQSKEILERLQHCFGPELVKRISFRLG